MPMILLLMTMITNLIKLGKVSTEGFGHMWGGQDNKIVGEGGRSVDLQNCSYRGTHKVIQDWI